jgi:hypothetical protein
VSKYEVVYCPNCRTEMHIKKEHRNSVIKCLCDKKLMVVTMNGKSNLEVLSDEKD